MTSSRAGWHHWAYRITILMVVLVVAALPFAFFSIFREFTDAEGSVLYDLPTGQPLSRVSDLETGDITYANIAVTTIDTAASTATIAISGHRACSAICPPLTIDLLSMGSNAAYRRGLPPSASISFAGGSEHFTKTVELPVQGSPVLYPFDHYTLVLGLFARIARPDDRAVNETSLTLSELEQYALITIQDQNQQLQMAPPRLIDPQSMSVPSDPFVPDVVRELRFVRAEYLRVLCVLLITLMTVSCALALFTRSINDLTLGIGGLILGIWGIRSVLVPHPLPTISAVDLALSGIILFLLLGLTIRAARYFRSQANVHQD